MPPLPNFFLKTIIICVSPRTEEGVIELLSLLLRHYNPKEGIHPKRGRDKGPLGDSVGKDRVWRESIGKREVSSEKQLIAFALNSW